MSVNQPAPIPNDRSACVDKVVSDLWARKAFGIEQYGTPLQPFNGRDAGKDLYEELQDALVYQRQHIDEFNELMLLVDQVIDAHDKGFFERLRRAIGLLKERRAQMKREV